MSGYSAVVCSGCIQPILNTVNIYLSIGAQGHLSVLTNDKLCAGKNREILIDCSISTYNVYGKVVGYGKVVILRINSI